MARPQAFDLNVHLRVKAGAHRRVQAFAEIQQVTIADAYRLLVGIALDSLEGADIEHTTHEAIA